MSIETNRQPAPDIIEQVNVLNDEVRILALNLAIYLAKAKKSSDAINKLEPDFIRLVNGVVKVVQELAGIINAARNEKKTDRMVRVDGMLSDPLEPKLHNILEQCQRVMAALAAEKEIKGKDVV